jgi:YD repeat-containing protein
VRDAAGLDVWNYAYAYDARGRRTEVIERSYDAQGAELVGERVRITYGYDALDRLTSERRYVADAAGCCIRRAGGSRDETASCGRRRSCGRS